MIRSLYSRIGEAIGTTEARRLAETLSRWHDEMVWHQRHVARVGVTASCSDSCPHAVAVDLWQEARAVYGAAADQLTFLRSTLEAPAAARPEAGPQPAASGGAA